jgi:hypothetical protein
VGSYERSEFYQFTNVHLRACHSTYLAPEKEPTGPSVDVRTCSCPGVPCGCLPAMAGRGSLRGPRLPRQLYGPDQSGAGQLEQETNGEEPARRARSAAGICLPNADRGKRGAKGLVSSTCRAVGLPQVVRCQSLALVRLRRHRRPNCGHSCGKKATRQRVAWRPRSRPSWSAGGTSSGACHRGVAKGGDSLRNSTASFCPWPASA